MNNFNGTIIDESLEDVSVLKSVKILSTEVEKVTDKHKTPWISKWTLHKVEIPESQAMAIAEKISRALDSKYSWYADFKNDRFHYIIFRDKVFFINRTSRKEYNAAKAYGISLGIPEYQVDFHPDMWK